MRWEPILGEARGQGLGTSKWPLLRMQELEQANMRSSSKRRATPVGEAKPWTQPMPGLVVSSSSQNWKGLDSDRAWSTGDKHKKSSSHPTFLCGPHLSPPDPHKDGDFCPECWLIGGTTSPLIRQAGRTGITEWL